MMIKYPFIKSSRSIIILLLFSIFGCSDEKATLIIYHGNILTMDSTIGIVKAIACKGDKIIAVGSSKDITKKYFHDKCQMIDLEGKFAMPGLIEGHGHFNSMGKSLSQLNLLHTDSWSAILDSIQKKANNSSPGEWIYGRGWHQEKWNDSLLNTVGGYPTHSALSAITPNNPVLLIHASGHALMTNAMGMKHLSKELNSPPGGRIMHDGNEDKTGIFEENAMSLIYSKYNEYQGAQSKANIDSMRDLAFQRAQIHCLKNGITSFQDAGSSFKEIEHFSEYDRGQKFDVRLSVMIYESTENMKKGLSNYPINNTGFFKANAVKTYADGALGSYGAYLLKPYTDKPDQIGQKLIPLDSLYEIAKLAIKHDLQLCVHAIGDKSNREILDMVENFQKDNQLEENHRWRIEHAQHINPKDISRFQKLGVIASIQTKHCTSDAPFVEKRLGAKRAKNGAYVWRSLLDAGAHLANGTDVPVEELNPFSNLYSAVTRRGAPNIDAFYPEQSMTRIEALKSYTIWNAFANFEEDIKGSLIAGKLADIVVLSNDLLHCSDDEILDTRVLYTIVGGEVKYEGDDD